MVGTALLILSLAVVLGGVAALWDLRGPRGRPPAWLGAIHAIIGIAGLGVLLIALQGPPRGVAYGVGGFGTMAAVVLSGALLAGVAIPVLARWRGRAPGVLAATHAGLAITGYVIFLAWALME